MNKLIRSHPDLMRRFVAAPFRFAATSDGKSFSVQSNDLEIALYLRRYALSRWLKSRSGSILCRIIRDAVAPHVGGSISIFDDGVVRVLYVGAGTVLLFDSEKSEVLGFLSKKVTALHLVSSLLPKLLGNPE